MKDRILAMAALFNNNERKISVDEKVIFLEKKIADLEKRLAGYENHTHKYEDQNGTNSTTKITTGVTK